MNNIEEYDDFEENYRNILQICQQVHISKYNWLKSSLNIVSLLYFVDILKFKLKNWEHKQESFNYDDCVKNLIQESIIDGEILMEQLLDPENDIGYVLIQNPLNCSDKTSHIIKTAFEDQLKLSTDNIFHVYNQSLYIGRKWFKEYQEKYGNV